MRRGDALVLQTKPFSKSLEWPMHPFTTIFTKEFPKQPPRACLFGLNRLLLESLSEIPWACTMTSYHHQGIWWRMVLHLFGWIIVRFTEKPQQSPKKVFMKRGHTSRQVTWGFGPLLPSIWRYPPKQQGSGSIDVCHQEHFVERLWAAPPRIQTCEYFEKYQPNTSWMLVLKSSRK